MCYILNIFNIYNPPYYERVYKGSVIIGFVFLVGLLVTPVSAEIESIFGKSLDGNEFVKIKAYPNINYTYENSFVVVHKDQVVSLTADPSVNNSTLKYNMNLANGNKLVLNKETFDAALQQLDWVEMKG